MRTYKKVGFGRLRVGFRVLDMLRWTTWLTCWRPNHTRSEGTDSILRVIKGLGDLGLKGSRA